MRKQRRGNPRTKPTSALILLLAELDFDIEEGGGEGGLTAEQIFLISPFWCVRTPSRPIATIEVAKSLKNSSVLVAFAWRVTYAFASTSERSATSEVKRPFMLDTSL